WTAEFRIPFSQLRFSEKTRDGERLWGLQVRRSIARLDEESDWAPTPRDQNVQVSAFGDLRGVDVAQPRNLEVAPYTVGSVARRVGDPADPFHRETAGRMDVGADLKYGLTSDLTLSAALNPDFGQ